MSVPAPEPGVLRRLEVDAEAPTPSDCLSPCEEPVATVELSPGWIAATDRELITYHPDRDPAVVRVARPNVTGVAVRRAAGETFLTYLPMAILYAFVALSLGVGFLAVEPTDYVGVPDAGPVGQLLGIVEAFGSALNLLGVVLVFTGILASLGAATVFVYWLTSREVRLVLERGDADPVECPTTRQSGTRAVQALGTLLGATDRSRGDASPKRPPES